MKRVGIIGMGVISQYYINGMKASKALRLVAVCDKEEGKATRQVFDEYAFYTEYLTMIREEGLDYVVLATPPATHYEIAKNCLLAGVNVLVEKPVTLEKPLFDDLMRIAKEQGKELQTMFHWRRGSEAEKFIELYDGSKITAIRVCVLDPYCEDGVSIKPDRVGLAGVWMDSGVNALSFIKGLLPFDSVKIEGVSLTRCAKTGLPVKIDVRLTIDGVAVEINGDWTRGENDKRSLITYEGREILVDHSKQTIFDGETQLAYDDMERLARHYYNLFAVSFQEGADQTDAVKVHETLFAVKEYYETITH